MLQHAMQKSPVDRTIEINAVVHLINNPAHVFFIIQTSDLCISESVKLCSNISLFIPHISVYSEIVFTVIGVIRWSEFKDLNVGNRLRKARFVTLNGLPETILFISENRQFNIESVTSSGWKHRYISRRSGFWRNGTFDYCGSPFNGFVFNFNMCSGYIHNPPSISNYAGRGWRRFLFSMVDLHR